jgi:hypothetical protein
MTIHNTTLPDGKPIRYDDATGLYLRPEKTTKTAFIMGKYYFNMARKTRSQGGSILQRPTVESWCQDLGITNTDPLALAFAAGLAGNEEYCA